MGAKSEAKSAAQSARKNAAQAARKTAARAARKTAAQSAAAKTATVAPASAAKSAPKSAPKNDARRSELRRAKSAAKSHATNDAKSAGSTTRSAAKSDARREATSDTLPAATNGTTSNLTDILSNEIGARTRPSAVVGIGASAGGLEALEAFFKKVPKRSGCAFVVVTHQPLGHNNLLPDLLGRTTSMPVVEVAGRITLAPDTVYVPKPGHFLAMDGDVLSMVERERALPLAHLPVDFFFRTLAHEAQGLAVGVVLSGAGSDATLGCREIKARLGMTMAQDPASARFSGMPLSAIGNGVVDYVGAAGDLPAQLIPFLDGARAPGTDEGGVADEIMGEIVALLRSRTGHDFSLYKPTTICRRIERRMHVQHIDDARKYVRYVAAHSEELDALYRELLIGVTSFFRDRQAFDALAAALEKYVDAKPDGAPMRIWVCACSTGEEAYSIAMLLREITERRNKKLNAQIFATDLDSRAIDFARAGVYCEGISSEIAPARLERFFTHEDGMFRVKKELRKLVVFATQNVITDPPFTNIDLLSCRNLLIYLDAKLHRRLFPIFHYALKDGGVLFLGPSESLGGHAERFEAIDKKWKLFSRRGDVRARPAITAAPQRDAQPALAAPPPPQERTLDAHTMERLLLRALVAPTVVVNNRGDILHVHGHTGAFLEPAQGTHATANILNMARGGLQLDLAKGLREARIGDEPLVRRGAHVSAGGETRVVDVHFARLSEGDGLVLITFEEKAVGPLTQNVATIDLARVTELERELRDTTDAHRTFLEEAELAAEEQRSTNKALRSANETLQSANEELETSKEEMRSLYEELQIVNQELHSKLEELTRLNDDMTNLLNGTSIAMVLLDHDLHIRRYTDQATRVFRLLPTDVGRPLADLSTRLRYRGLIDDARDVLRTLRRKELEAQSDAGDWYLLRVLPYRTAENVIDGVLITFVDVTGFRRRTP